MAMTMDYCPCCGQAEHEKPASPAPAPSADVVDEDGIARMETAKGNEKYILKQIEDYPWIWDDSETAQMIKANIVDALTARAPAPSANGVPLDLNIAADAFRKTLIPRADANHGGAPMWYGWAIFDAYVAGFRAAEKHNLQKPE